MKKEDAGMLGWAIGFIVALSVVYFLTEKKWWQWVLAILFIPGIFTTIGYALGKEDPAEVAAKANEKLREQRCKDKGGRYVNGQCGGDFNPKTSDWHVIDLKV